MYHGSIAAFIAKCLLPNSNILFYIHHSEIFGKSLKLRTKAIALLVGLLSTIFNIKTLFCSNKGLKKHLETTYSRKNSIYIPNGFKINRKDFISSLKLRSSSTKIVRLCCVARWDIVKNHALLLRAFTMTRHKYPNIELYLVGDGMCNDNQHLTDMISPDVSQYVHLLGYSENITGIISKMDFLILTSTSEAFPMSIGEAMALGIPCIASDVGDTKILIDDTGWIFPNNELSKLLVILEKVIKMRTSKAEDYYKLCDRCYNRILKFYSQEIIMSKLESYINPMGL